MQEQIRRIPPLEALNIFTIRSLLIQRTDIHRTKSDAHQLNNRLENKDYSNIGHVLLEIS
jgi:hypothetical protein